ncbi:MAG: hypothetical protein V4638_02030 [Bacteroidota bacterium]
MKAGKLLLTILIVGALAFPTSVFANWSQDDDINKKDVNGKKQGKWIYFGKDRPTAGYPSDGKIEEGPYLDDRKEGLWVIYHTDGITPKLKGEFHNNRPEGQYTKIYPNGKIKEQGTFERTLYKDSLIRYHENGKVEYQANYNEQGNEQGKVVYRYANGQVEYEYQANNGKPNGKATRYYENGDIKEIIYYNELGEKTKSEVREMVNAAVVVKDPGASNVPAPKITSPRTKGVKFQPNGYNKVYNKNDEIWQDGIFKNSVLWDGKVYEYDSDGILLKVKVFKNGVYHSDGQL